VADTLDELVARLPLEGRTTFRRLTEGMAEPLEVIVCFLALLELCKRGAVDLDQAGRLGELGVKWLGLPAQDEPRPAFGAGDGVPVGVRAEPAMAGVDEYEG
jgi:segregation and condensation protein A